MEATVVFGRKQRAGRGFIRDAGNLVRLHGAAPVKHLLRLPLQQVLKAMPDTRIGSDWHYIYFTIPLRLYLVHDLAMHLPEAELIV